MVSGWALKGHPPQLVLHDHCLRRTLALLFDMRGDQNQFTLLQLCLGTQIYPGLSFSQAIFWRRRDPCQTSVLVKCCALWQYCLFWDVAFWQSCNSTFTLLHYKHSLATINCYDAGEMYWICLHSLLFTFFFNFSRFVTSHQSYPLQGCKFYKVSTFGLDL